MLGSFQDDLRAARKAAAMKATMGDFDDDQLLKELEVRSPALLCLSKPQNVSSSA